MERFKITLYFLISFQLLGIMSSGSGQEFPYHDALKTDIRFWKKVFTEIHSNQYLIHDSEYLSIVYEVVSFDSTVSERQQEKRIEKIKEGYKKLLLKFHYNRQKLSELPPREQKLTKQFEGIKEKNKFKKAAKRIRAQRGIRENFLSGVERSFAYLPSMEKIFNYYDLPKNLIYMPHIESSFNPRAASHVGARGMWQFMRSTARLYMRVNSRVDERYDPVYSTRAAAKLLKKNYQVLKDWALAITAYNHGLGSMKRARRKFGRDYLKIRENYLRRSFGFASKNFYPEFLAVVELMDSLDHYFPGLNKHQPLEFQDLKLTRSINLPRFCRKMKISINELKELNPSYKRSLWRGSRKIPKGYNLRLPAETDMKQVLAYFYEEAVKQNLALSREKQKGLQQTSVSRGKVNSTSGKTIAVNLLKPSVESGETRVDIGKIKLAFKESGNKSMKEINPRETFAIKIARQTNVDEAGKNLKKRLTISQLEEILASGLAIASGNSPQKINPAETGNNFPANSGWLLPKPGVESGQLAAGYEFKTIKDLLPPQTHFVFLPGQLMIARPIVDEGGFNQAVAANELETHLNAIIQSLNSIENESQMMTRAVKGGEASAKSEDSEEVLVPASATDIMTGSENFVNSASSVQPFPSGDDPYQLPKPMVTAGYRSTPESYHKNLISEKTHLNYRDIVDILRVRLQVKGNKIVVYPNETIGHFADWLNIRASRLRRQNKIEYGKPIYAGQVIRLDFSATTIEEFNEKRLRYHTNLVIQMLEGKTEIRFVEHRINPGENLWTLAHKRNNFPVNLLLYFNDLNKLEQLYPGDIIKLPIL